mgnify:CR=1 FL=1
MISAVEIFWAVVLAYAVSCGFFCNWLAREKGREAQPWFLLGLVFNFIALLTLVGAPALEYEEEEEE